MRSVTLGHEVDFEGWRRAARSLALQGIPPEEAVFSVVETDDLFAEAPVGDAPQGTFSVSRGLVELAECVIQAREPARFSLLYGLIWRAHRGERHLLEDVADPAVQRAQRLAQSVRRDIHKMRAFVRFREVAAAEGTRYVAWFEPEHFIVEANAAFFVRRFATMVFSILTPYRSMHWDGETVRLTAGADPSEVPDDDALEAYWRAYFSSVFNPARLKLGAMISEMPKKYWKNLPEAAAIPELVRASRERTETMVSTPVFSPARAARVPPAREAARVDGSVADNSIAGNSVEVLARAAATCQRCHLWQPATQTVFGEGPPDARMMLVGEQPGDQEDLAGRPFVGPAGQVLNRALAEAGIDRGAVYVTNAVKHFKFEPRGKRRIHATPDRVEIEACRFWLDQERAAIAPAVTVLLGASAARAGLGRAVTISRERGRGLPFGAGQAVVTVHPSYLLRLPDEESKTREYAAFVADLKLALSLVS